MTRSIEELRAELAVAEASVATASAALNEGLRNTLVACTSNNFGKGCGTALEIGELEYIQTHWYESPHGCSGGDHWHEGEGQFICPHCGHRNRLYDRKDVKGLKHLFKSITKAYPRN
jgi:hypothetical protein